MLLVKVEGAKAQVRVVMLAHHRSDDLSIAVVSWNKYLFPTKQLKRVLLAIAVVDRDNVTTLFYSGAESFLSCASG